ncbi:hypothetical protein P3T76_007789 [Phytophthora citrophthora]|uniref:RxLR effector PexRD54 WY domain-containing protein n=1 Tax=Phytophthora citrophthora TaxID=4793 RepID=A0AAD9GMU0_9STRA|nr:hypothetical protein P3T76_007789 [Phytophthora citrophthora]
MRLYYVVLAAAVASLSTTTIGKPMDTNTGNSVVNSLQNFLVVGRLLRTIDDEERGFTLTSTGKLTDLFESTALKLAQSARFKNWLVKGTSTDDAFLKLGLNTAGSKIFEDPKLLTWVVYVTKVEKQNPEEIILTRLSKQFTEGSLAKMIASAKQVSKTEGLATILQAQQRQVWLNAGKSSDDVFKLLQLDEAGTKLFKNQQFSTWTSFVDTFNRKNPEEAVSIFAKLVKTYDDFTLWKMLEAAKKVPKTEIIASKLQTQQIDAWLDAGKSTDDVFKLLKLHKTGDKLFKNPQMLTWVSYVEKFNKRDPDQAIAIFSKLAGTYDQVTLSSMLEAAKHVPSTKKIASYLQGQQNQHWLSDGKSTDDIFKLLKLDTPDLNILIDPRLDAWTSFMRAFNMANEGKEATLIATLTTHYTDHGLTQLLQEGTKFASTKKIAEELQVAQFARWMQLGKTEDDVFALLKMKPSTPTTDPEAIVFYRYKEFLDAHT